MVICLATWVHDWSPFLIEFGNGLGIRWYGLSYVLGFVFGFWMMKWLANNGYSEIASQRVGDFIAGVAFFGVLAGGRLGYMLFYNFDEFLREPWITFQVWDGGMSSHGGILGIVIFTWFYARRNKISWPGLGDNLVVVAPLGIFMGRVANFINGELYGRITSVPWGVKFPKEFFTNDSAPDDFYQALETANQISDVSVPPDQLVAAIYANDAVREAVAPFISVRHPSQIYEALLEGLLLFVVLLAIRLRWKNLRHGILTGVFFVGYAVVRIIGEMYRQPDASLVLNLTRGQFLSLFMIVIGALFLCFAGKGRVRETTDCK